MGLSVSTQVLADMLEREPEGADWIRAQLAIINDLLAARGLPRHEEPERRGKAVARTDVLSSRYSSLHCLRRAFVRARAGQPVDPVKPGEDPARDPVVKRFAAQLNAHLLSHSDDEGFYVPVDFDRVILDVDGRGLAGHLLGSTQRLLAELIEVAPAIGISLDGGELSDAEVAKLSAEDPEHAPLFTERMVWLVLFENARVSLANGTMIVFG